MRGLCGKKQPLQKEVFEFARQTAKSRFFFLAPQSSGQGREADDLPQADEEAGLGVGGWGLGRRDARVMGDRDFLGDKKKNHFEIIMSEADGAVAPPAAAEAAVVVVVFDLMSELLTSPSPVIRCATYFGVGLVIGTIVTVLSRCMFGRCILQRSGGDGGGDDEFEVKHD